jgi:hypothetical protein
MKKKNSLQVVGIILLSLLSISIINAQGTAGSDAKFEYRYLVDMPTAGILKRGDASVEFISMPYGTAILKVESGVFNNFSIGVSYGAVNAIGVGNPEWYPLPGVVVRARLLTETKSLPGILLGFDSQGKGNYIKNFQTSDTTVRINRYLIKSPGFFLAISKNFAFLGYFSIHSCVNYTLERSDKDKDANFSFGIEKTIGGFLSFVGEYDFAFNDNSKVSLGKKSGYLNLGLRWSIAEGLTFGLDFRDILDNDKISQGRAERSIRIDFIQPIF